MRSIVDAVVPRHSPQWSATWIASVLAAVIFANGMIGMMTVLVTRFPEHPVLLPTLLPLGLLRLNRSLTVALGLLLVYLSFQLSERRYVAWWAANTVVLLAIVLHLTRREWGAALVGAVTAGLLAVARRRFTLRTDPRRALQGIGVAGATMLIALSYGTGGFWLLESRDFNRTFSLGEAAVRSLRELAFLGNPDIPPATRHGAWFLDSLRLLGALAGLLLAWSLYRPLAYRLRT